MVLSRLIIVSFACIACAGPASAELAGTVRHKTDASADHATASTRLTPPAGAAGPKFTRQTAPQIVPKVAPLPVPRPAGQLASPQPLTPAPVPALPSSPPVDPAANAAPATTQSIPDVPVDEATPLERRDRVRVCGTEWMTRKKEGTTAGQTWHDFATGCFARGS